MSLWNRLIEPSPGVMHRWDVTFARIFLYSAAFYPLLWATGFAALFMPILGVVGLFYLLKARAGLFTYLPLLIAVCIVLSLPFGVIEFGLDFSRATAALYNTGVWVLIAALLTLAVRVDIRRAFSWGLLVIIVVQTVLLCIALSIFPERLPVPVFSHFVQSLPGNFGPLGRPDMVSESWFGQRVMRTSGILSQAVSAGAFAATAVIAYVTLQGVPVAARVIGIVAALPVVVLSWARTTWALLVLVLFVSAMSWLMRRGLRTIAIAIGSMLIAGTAILFLWGERILALLTEVVSARPGSSTSRGNTYESTFEYVAIHPFPLLGYGMKPREESLPNPLASHSTVLGLLFRAGIVGVVLYVALIVLLLVRAIRMKDISAGAITLFLAAWSLQADLDVGHIVPLMLVLSIVPSPRGGCAEWKFRSAVSRGVGSWLRIPSIAVSARRN